MLTRIVIVAALALHVAACVRISPTEKQVVGTWKWIGMDAISYYIFKEDHSLQLVSAYDSSGRPNPLLISNGVWRVEGDHVVIESAIHVEPGIARTPPPRHTDRLALADFGKDLKPHPPVTYSTSEQP
jgi:hypothetical protein